MNYKTDCFIICLLKICGPEKNLLLQCKQFLHDRNSVRVVGKHCIVGRPTLVILELAGEAEN